MKQIIKFLVLSTFLFFHNGANGQPGQENYEKGMFLYSHDVDNAYKLLEKAGAKGHIKALESLGDINYERKNRTLAKHFYKKAADKNSPHALYALAVLAYEDNNYEEAYKYLYKGQLNGSADAAALLGGFYYDGVHVEKNIESAKFYYERAAKNGSLRAQLDLGHSYYLGDKEGFPKNDKQAATYLNMYLKDNAILNPYYVLGKIYFEGDGVARNYSIAAGLFAEAASIKEDVLTLSEINDITKGIKHLAAAKYFISFIENNESSKNILLREAAIEGHIPSIIYLAYKAEENRSFDKAISWYEKAAEKDNEHAKSKVKYLKNLQKRFKPSSSNWEKIGESKSGTTYYAGKGYYVHNKPFFTMQILERHPSKKLRDGEYYNEIMYDFTIHYDDNGYTSYFVPNQNFYYNGQHVTTGEFNKEFNISPEGKMDHIISEYLFEYKGSLNNILRHFTLDDFN